MRVDAKALKRLTGRLSVIVLIGLSVAGCSLDGTQSSAFLITNSVGPAGPSDLNQSLPQAFADNGSVQVADSDRYIPRASVGNDHFDFTTTASVEQTNTLVKPSTTRQSAIRQSTLPDLAPSVSMSKVSTPMAHSNTETAALTDLDQPVPELTARPRIISVPDDSVIHQVDKGESLYTIARHYDVSVENLYTANSMQSSDRLRIGQNLIVPGVSGSVVAKPQQIPEQQVAALAPIVPKMIKKPRISAQQVAAFQRQAKTGEVQLEGPALLARPKPVNKTVNKPAQMAKAAAPEAVHAQRPQHTALQSEVTNLRWPVQGQVTATFKANNPGIKIDVPAGSLVRAAEGGEVIYVGSGIKGYGNLVLMRHAGGIVTVYAHLQDVMVKKGQRLNRGDSLARVGMSGNVTRPMLHFEVRKDAKPVDPMNFLV